MYMLRHAIPTAVSYEAVSFMCHRRCYYRAPVWELCCAARWFVLIGALCAGTTLGLQAFVSPAAPVVRGIHITTARSGPGHQFDVTDYGPTGLNYSDPNHTIWGHDTYFDASGPLRAAIAAAAAAAAAARAASPGGDVPDQVIFFPPGIYNVQGGFKVPDGVYIAGAGADVTAIYIAYDDQTTAPLAYFSPAAPGGSWGLRDLSIYCLSFFYNIVHIPASPVGQEEHTL